MFQLRKFTGSSRAEELADVKIFATANREVKKDPAMVSSYRYLQTLRIKFDDLITTIGNLGRKETDAREIEGKTEQLAERVSKNHTGRILADIQQVRQENAQLAENIRDALRWGDGLEYRHISSTKVAETPRGRLSTPRRASTPGRKASILSVAANTLGLGEKSAKSADKNAEKTADGDVANAA